MRLEKRSPQVGYSMLAQSPPDLPGYIWVNHWPPGLRLPTSRPVLRHIEYPGFWVPCPLQHVAQDPASTGQTPASTTPPGVPPARNFGPALPDGFTSATWTGLPPHDPPTPGLDVSGPSGAEMTHFNEVPGENLSNTTRLPIILQLPSQANTGPSSASASAPNTGPANASSLNPDAGPYLPGNPPQ